MEQSVNTEITIRRMDLTDEGRAALAVLAGRDSRPVPEAPVLGLEVEGTLLAATSMADGATIADPFARTGELRELLVTRATQLRRRRPARRRLPSARRPRPAVGGSPAGQIISLPHWG